MAKSSTRFVCSECGHDEAKWLGHCPSCGAWNSFKEFNIAPRSKGSTKPVQNYTAPKASTLSEVTLSERPRLFTGMGEFDRVLGQGVMKGSAVLVGGEPGIGKSTLLLQLASTMGKEEKILYISGEESAEQIKIRGERLKLQLEKVRILCDSSLENILHVCEEESPGIVIVDSIQTLITPRAGEVPGTVNQLKLSSSELIEWSRKNGGTLFLVAHVTKEGTIAGPRAIEHMVDTVLYFEHSGDELRCLRAQKNRFGSTQELGLFTMDQDGLQEVSDPGSFFLQKRNSAPPSGTVTAAVYEGSRILLVEIQALTVPAKGGLSRIYAEKIENNRISRIAAVLEKHIGLRFSDQDIYVHVAGGLRISETGSDLPLALALYSARTGLPLKQNLLSMGELSLSGEIRNIPHQDRRIKAAGDQGYTQFLTPKSKKAVPKALAVEDLKQAIQEAFQVPKN